MDSAVAQLKLEALLAEVRVDYGAVDPQVDAAVEALREAVKEIPEKEVPRSLAEGFLQDLGVPPSKSYLEFKRPESFTVIGSYATRSMAKPVTVVDVAMRIPKTCFYEKDFLNHRYHAKRALYLAYVFKFVKKCGFFESVEWDFLHHDARKPVLILRTASISLDLRVLPTIANNVFDASKLDNERNNVHGQGASEATPNYNGSILEDMFVEELSSVEKNILCKSERLQETVILLKVWLRQRNAYRQADTLNGFLLAMIVLHFSSSSGGQRLTSHMTALQMFRVVLDIIGSILAISIKSSPYVFRAAKHEVLATGFRLDLEGISRRPGMMANESCVFFPDTYATNLLFRISKSALEELRNLADRTLEAIRVSSYDCGFQESFLTTLDFPSNFDYQISLEVGDASKVQFANDGAWRVTESLVERILTSALKDRAKLVRVMRRTNTTSWNPKKSLSKVLQSRIHVGLILNDSDTAFRNVDVGPSADNREEAAKFRSFWGKKAELRRFKDGTIAEAVGWECEWWKRHLIIPRIAKYILSRHLAVSETDVEAVSDQLDFALANKCQDSIGNTPRILKALEDFTKHLKSLDLPLKVSSVQPISPAFRHAAVYPPAPRSSAKAGLVGVFLEPLDVMIQLEGSGRWPNDLKSIQKTKAAFCLKIADSLQKQRGLESVVSENAVDVLISGFAFRISIYYEKDPTLVKHKGISVANNQPKIVRLENDLKFQSMHSSTLGGLHGRYPAYGPTVRLAKRWIGAHLFSDVIAEEAIELLVAYVFTRPNPMFPPSTRITGFLRFLRLLAGYDWHLSPLIVDINGDMASNDRESIIACFEKTRKGAHSDLYEGSKEGPAMFIATLYDTQSLTCTRCSPTKQSLKRLVAYAKSSATLLTSNITGSDSRWQSLFRTPLKCYDAVIVLQRKSLPDPGRVLFPAKVDSLLAVVEFPESASHLGFRVTQLMVGFNPVMEFVSEVKAKFGDLFDVWHDSLESDIIGLTWRSEVPGSKRKRNDVRVSMQSVSDLGKGLVKSIHLTT